MNNALSPTALSSAKPNSGFSFTRSRNTLRLIASNTQSVSATALASLSLRSSSAISPNMPPNSELYEAIMARLTMPADEDDEELMDALATLNRAVLDHKNITLTLLAQGDFSELRRVAKYLLEKDLIDKDILDATMARIASSRDTQDSDLADSLAWLCKVILKSGDVKYKVAMTDIAETAASSQLQKYAKKAASGL